MRKHLSLRILLVLAVLLLGLAATAYAEELSVSRQGSSYYYCAPESTVELKVTATGGTGELTYEWRKGNRYSGEIIEGATGDTCQYQAVEGTTIYCTVTDEEGVSEYTYFNIYLENHLTMDYAKGREENYVPLNSTVELGVTASCDVGGKTYQWRKDGSDIEGATSENYTVVADTRASYVCYVYDDYGAYDSRVFEIYIDNGMTVDYAKGSKAETVVKANGTAQLGVRATHKEGELTYEWSEDGHEWYYSGTVMAGETGASISIQGTAENNGRYFWCRVKDAYGNSDELSFHVTVDNNLIVDYEKGKAETVVKPDDTVELGVYTTHDQGELTYKWTTSEYNYGYSYGTEMAGETGASISIPATAENNGKYFWCRVSDEFGNSDVLGFHVTVDNGLIVDYEKGKAETTVKANDTVELGVYTTHDQGELTYKWTEDGVDMEGETGATISVQGTKENNDKYFYCRVSDAYGNSEGLGFHVTVDNGLTLDYDKGDEENIVKPDETLELGVTATHDKGELTYKWLKCDDGYTSYYYATEMEGETGASISIQGTKENNEQYFWCSVSDEYGNSVQLRFRVVVDNLTVEYDKGDQETTVKPDETVELGVTATRKKGELTYQWRKDGMEMEGETGASISVQGTEANNGKYFYCSVSDEYGNTKELGFHVTVDNGLTLAYAKGGSENTVKPDATVELGVTATRDAGELTYVWRKTPYYYSNAYGTVLEGETGASISIQGTKENNEQYFWCSVSDEYGNKKELRFHVTVDNGLSVDYDKGAEVTTVKPDETVELGVTATRDAGELTYEWTRDGTVLKGQTGASISVQGTAANGGKYFYCKVSDEYGNSDQLSFRVVVDNLTVEYDKGEEETIVKPDDEFELGVKATSGTGNLTYRWSKHDYDYYYVTELKGRVGASISIPATEENNDQYFLCSVSDEYGNTKELSFHVTVDNGLTLAYAKGGEENTVKPNETVELGVTATHDVGDLTYAWSRGNTVLKGETGVSISIQGTAENNGQTFYCTVSDEYGNTRVLDFYVEVDNGLTVDYDKGDEVNTVKPDETIELGVTATRDVGDLTYAWSRGDTVLEGETAASISIQGTAKNNGQTFYCTVSDEYGNTRSLDFEVIVENLTVAYDKGKAENTVKPDATVELGVKATHDAGNLTYTWRRGNAVMEGETGASISIQGTAENNGQTFWCRVSDEYGNSEELRFRVTVDNGLTVNYDKGEKETIVKLNDTVELGVKATRDAGDLTYEWRRGNKVLEGETAASISIQATAENGGQSFYCTVSDEYGNTKQLSFHIVIDNGLTLAYAKGEKETTVKPNETVELGVTTTHETGELTYVWRKTPYNYSNAYGTVMGGETGASISIQATAENNGKYFWCSVSDEYGNTQSLSFHVTIDNGLTLAYAKGGEENTVKPNETLELGVTATHDEGELTYAWTRDGTVLKGETGASISVQGTAENNGASFWCSVSDEYGNSKYLDFYVEVDNGLTLDYDKGEKVTTVKLNDTVELGVKATHDVGELTYEWRRDGDTDYFSGKVIKGETGTSITIPATAENGGKTFWCRVSDEYGNSKSLSFLVVIDNGLIVEYAKGGEENTVKPDETIELGVKATRETGELTYKWSRDGKVMRREKGDSITISGTAENNHKSFYCSVSDDYGNTEVLSFHVTVDNGFSVNRVSRGQQGLKAGEQATLKVQAECDKGALSYEWSEGEYESSYYMTEIAGADKSELTIEEVQSNKYYWCTVNDEYGNSETVSFRIVTDNHLFAEPVKGGVFAVSPGEDITLQVNASCLEGDLHYRWTNNNNGEYVSAEGNTLTLENVTEYSSYYCRVSDDFGSSVNAFFTVSIDNDFVAYADGPITITVPYDTATTLAVKASCREGEPTYSWHTYSYGVELDDQGLSTLTTPKLTKDTNIYCTVTDKYGNTADIEFYCQVLSEDEDDDGVAFYITYVDSNTYEVQPGDNVTLQVKPYGAVGEVTYEWESSEGVIGVPAGDSFTINDIQYGGTVNCLATCEDELGIEHYSEVTFTLVLNNQFTAKPVGNTYILVKKDDPAEMAVEASCLKGELSYQWYRQYIDGSSMSNESIPGAINPTYAIPTVTEGALYLCTVKDEYNNRLQVYFTVAIDDQFTAMADGDTTIAVAPGSDVTLKVTAGSATGAPSYRWFKQLIDANGVVGKNMPLNVTGASITLKNVEQRHKVTCVVSDDNGNKAMINYSINIDNALTVKAKKEEFTVEKGESVTMTAEASCTKGGLKVQWLKGKNVVEGAIELTYTAENVQESGSYTCVVSDFYGNSESASFFIAVPGGEEIVEDTNDFKAELEGKGIRWSKDGSNITLKVKASVKNGGIYYRWKSNGRAIASATSASYTATAARGNTTYQCTVWDDFNHSATLSVDCLFGEIPALKLDTPQTGIIDHSNGLVAFSYTPSRLGEFTFTTSSGTRATLYSPEWEARESGTRIVRNLVNDKTFYFVAKFDSSSRSGEVSVKISRTGDTPEIALSLPLRVGQTVTLPMLYGNGTAQLAEGSCVALSGAKLTANAVGEAKVQVAYSDKVVTYSVTVEQDVKVFKLPAKLQKIGANAYLNNTALTYVELGDAIQSVGENAFAGSGVKQIVIPGKNTVLAETALKDAAPLVLCKKGSVAEEFASSNGLTFAYIS